MKTFVQTTLKIISLTESFYRKTIHKKKKRKKTNFTKRCLNYMQQKE